jgi:hypothetical protein
MARRPLLIPLILPILRPMRTTRMSQSIITTTTIAYTSMDTRTTLYRSGAMQIWLPASTQMR